MAESTTSWGALLAETERGLGAAGLTNAANEARWIVETASGLDAAELAARPDTPATVRGVAALDRMVARRLGGEPLQYVLGHWSFRGLDLMVDRRVLIPRPETEQLVDLALDAVDRVAARGVDPVTVVDLGTGSGAIGLAIASERVSTRVILTDVDDGALAVARANLAGIGRPATRVEIRAGHWFGALDPASAGSVDVVVSNPPYVADADEVDPVVAAHEPVRALRSGSDGLDAARTLLGEVRRWLAPRGEVVLELGEGQPDVVTSHAEAAGLVAVDVRADLAGRRRFLRAAAP